MKITTILEIGWADVTEVLAVDDTVREGSVIYTTETWPDNWGGLEVGYSADVVKYRVGAENELHLNYMKEKQANPRFFTAKMGVRWGTWQITWRNSKKAGKATWIDDEASYDTKSMLGNVKVLQWQRLALGKRKKASRVVAEHPDQHLLRKTLLRMDKRCAISHQRDVATLDVAHIIPAKNLNYDVTDNAILLRADLHKLFDAGLIRLSAKRGEASFECSQKLSQNYRELVETAALDPAIFKRIGSAIPVRARMKIGMPTKK